MRKIAAILLALLLIVPAAAQTNPFDRYPHPGNGNLAGGFGLNWIDGQLYYTFHFFPEIAFYNFGVGLDLNFDIDRNGNIRKENFNTFSDYLSIIRYVRYGMKYDPVYVKLGALDYYTLGHGSIINQYNNSPSFDNRRIGLVADIDFGDFGFESIYGNFAQAGLVGLRGYVRPLHFTTLASVPILGNLEVGATYATDLNKYSGIIFHAPSPGSSNFIDSKDDGAMTVVGADLGLPLLSTSLLKATLYTDYSKIINFGSGVATGIKLDINTMGLVTGSVKLERRFNNGQYIPSYFNSLYEVERYQVDSTSLKFRSKATTLANIKEADNGYFGELRISALGLLDVIGSYERLDKTPNSGILHLDAQVAPDKFPMLMRAGYDKINITNEKDIFTLDDRSYLYFEMGYKPYPYLLVSMLYKWTFSPVYDADHNVIDFQPQKRIEPRVSFIYPFNFGG